MQKVVHFIHGLNTGGAETLVKDYALLLDKEKYDIQILCYEHSDSPYEKLLRDSGINVIYVCDKMPFYGKKSIFAKIINRIMQYMLIRRSIRKLAPDILHTHLIVNRYVKFSRPHPKTRIIHTVHNEPKKLWFNGKKERTKDLQAAKWLVKHYQMQFVVLHEKMRSEVNALFDVTNTIVLNNGIHYSKFEKIRSREIVRQDLRIPENAFVMGHVGRFTLQKNHRFLVEIFSEVYKRKNNAYLLMIGDGVEKQKIVDQLSEFALQGKYQILSNRLDIPDLLNAMDVFVFPSLFEGLGIAVIEAQKMKLPCVVSDQVPDAAGISNLVRFEKLSSSSEEWAEQVCTFSPKQVEYYNAEAWDMKNVILKLQDIYQGEI